MYWNLILASDLSCLRVGERAVMPLVCKDGIFDIDVDIETANAMMLDEARAEQKVFIMRRDGTGRDGLMLMLADIDINTNFHYHWSI